MLKHHRGANGRFSVVPAEQRFWERVEKTETCWLWRGAISSTGYGGFAPSPRGDGPAHRYAYELLVGTIPEGLTIDHLCRVRACVNPAHLEAVTYAENNRRMWADIKAARTHWPCGHPYTEENCYRWARGESCWTCKRRRGAEAQRRRRVRMVAG